MILAKKNNRCLISFPHESEVDKCKEYDENPKLRKGRYLCVKCGRQHKRSGNGLKSVMWMDESRNGLFAKEYADGFNLGLCEECVDKVLDFIYAERESDKDGN